MLFFMLIFIYILAALDFSGGIWDLVSWSGIKLGHSALWAWSLSHWTTREVPHAVFCSAFCFIKVLVSRSLINMNVEGMESLKLRVQEMFYLFSKIKLSLSVNPSPSKLEKNPTLVIMKVTLLYTHFKLGTTLLTSVHTAHCPVLIKHQVVSLWTAPWLTCHPHTRNFTEVGSFSVTDQAFPAASVSPYFQAQMPPWDSETSDLKQCPKLEMSHYSLSSLICSVFHKQNLVIHIC